MFNELLALIAETASLAFLPRTKRLAEFVNETDGILDIIQQVGIIPESIDHDSSEEKVFAKISDAVLSRTFRELGLKSTLIIERADAADVIAESQIHGYSLVADAKAFRMSRTAKNQKDFKVTSLSGWRKDHNYAVLCSSFFQYPRKQSQIYKQATDYNVALISWEHLILLLKYNIKETDNLNLGHIWNYCEQLSQQIVVAESKRCFIPKFNQFLADYLHFTQNEFAELINTQIEIIESRGNIERGYLERQKTEIMSYSHEKAISELIKSKKIDEKIGQIES
ncbi:MAG: HindIII family type II restriction endonuclease, partial [Holophagaceae bacterium]|nr:HindIII family type II restriction endonuclease [Holophagaceae bacterium]